MTRSRLNILPEVSQKPEAPCEANQSPPRQANVARQSPSPLASNPPDSIGALITLPKMPEPEVSASEDASPPKQVSEYPPILTLNEAAKLLRCSKAHLSNVLNGKVPTVPPLLCVRIGRRKLVRRDSLLKWVEFLEGRRMLS